jgi:hypothetical protein
MEALFSDAGLAESLEAQKKNQHMQRVLNSCPLSVEPPRVDDVI